jgi:hypothetical protein
MEKIKIFFTVIAIVIVTSACESYDEYDTDRATIAGFTLTNTNFKIPSGGTRDKEITIFVSDVANSDRTFTVSVVSEDTEVAAENYTFNPTVVIPANERSTDFTLTGIDVSLTEEKLPLTLKIDATNGVVSGGRLTAQIYK